MTTEASDRMPDELSPRHLARRLIQLGAVDGGLIGAFALYHQPLAVTTAAVLVYLAIALWIPALLGSVAFVQLRRTLERDDQAAAICAPLAEPIEIVRRPSMAAQGSRS